MEMMGAWTSDHAPIFFALSSLAAAEAHPEQMDDPHPAILSHCGWPADEHSPR